MKTYFICTYLLLGFMGLWSAALFAAKPIVLSDQHKDLVRWAFKTMRENNITIPALELSNQCPNWAEHIDRVLWLSDFFAKMAEKEDIIELATRVKDGFYGNSGELVRRILLNAAQNKDARNQLIQGYQWEECSQSYAAGWLDPRTYYNCGFPPLDIDKFQFKISALKRNIDALKAKLIELGLPKLEASQIKVQDLDSYEPFLQIFVKLESQLSELISFPCELYMKKSLQDVSASELRVVLEKLSSFLRNDTDGVVGIIKNSMPRKQ